MTLSESKIVDVHVNLHRRTPWGRRTRSSVQNKDLFMSFRGLLARTPPWIHLPTKTGPVRFCWFIEKWSVEFEIFKKLRNFKIKNSKKTSLHFNNFGQNRIQWFIVFHRRKIEAASAGVKIKKHFYGFLLTQEYNGLILFAPCLFPTRTPLPSLAVRHCSIYVIVHRPASFDVNRSVNRHSGLVFASKHFKPCLID
jgi:hypothetical protein